MNLFKITKNTMTIKEEEVLKYFQEKIQTILK